MSCGRRARLPPLLHLFNCWTHLTVGPFVSVCRIGKGPRNPPRITAQALQGRVPQAQAGAEVWAEAAGSLGNGAEGGSLRGQVRAGRRHNGPALHGELSARGFQSRFPGSVPPMRRVPMHRPSPRCPAGLCGTTRAPEGDGPRRHHAWHRCPSLPCLATPRPRQTPASRPRATAACSRVVPLRPWGVEWACPPSSSIQRNGTVFTACLPKEAGSRWPSGRPANSTGRRAIALSSPRLGASTRPGRAGRAAWGCLGGSEGAHVGDTVTP